MKDFEMVVNDKPQEPVNETGNYWVNYDLPDCKDNWDLIYGTSERDVEAKVSDMYPDCVIIESRFYGTKKP